MNREDFATDRKEDPPGTGGPGLYTGKICRAWQEFRLSFLLRSKMAKKGCPPPLSRKKYALASISQPIISRWAV